MQTPLGNIFYETMAALLQREGDFIRAANCLIDHVSMISGKPMTFKQRKQLVKKYIVGHYLDRFSAKISDVP